MAKAGIQEIARLAGVSIGTVDRALHGRSGIRQGTRQRILDIAKSLRYKPDLAARALSTRRKATRIAICIPREIHFYFDQLRNGLLNEARRFESLGVQPLYHPTERLGVGEADAVAEVIRVGDVQALIIAPGDPGMLNSAIDEAETKGIRVICVDTDAPESARSCVVCVDAKVSGMLAGELLGRFLSPGSRVAVMTGMLQVDDHRQKVNGFCEAFPQNCEGGNIAAVLEDHEDENEAFVKSFSLLKENANLAGIYVSTGDCLPVCRAIKALGLEGKVKLLATELFEEAIPFIEQGIISACVTGRAYAQGQLAMRLAVDHFLFDLPLPPARHLLPHVVMRSNLHVLNGTRAAASTDRLLKSHRR